MFGEDAQSNQKPQQSLSLEHPKRLSRDEMNLAEFPLTVLSTRSDPSIKTLEFKDTVKGRNGDVVERKWIITGADKFGLPTASDDEVLLGLLKLTVDDGMRERKVYFTRYELLKTLKWTTEGRSYTRLQKALDRLSGVRIKASNAFYDNETKVHSTRNFGIVDAYEINTGKDAHAKTSYFTWSETLFKSFQVGFIKKLDLDYYLDLKSSVSKRLYRYLDKHFWYKSKVVIDLFTLAHEKIGVSRTYQYASSIRQILDPAIEELVKTGFLSSGEFVGKGKGSDVVFISGKNSRRKEIAQNEQPIAATSLVSTQQPDIGDEIIEGLIRRGLNEKQVVRLVAGRSEETLIRISQIINYYDYLLASNSRLVSRSPQGFLFRAVENPERFVLPGDAQRKPKQEELPVQFAKVKPIQTKMVHAGRDESEYLVARKQAIRAKMEVMNPSDLHALTVEVEHALGKIRTLISPTRFQEAVTHGVEEKIATSLAFPSFDEWRGSHAA